MSYFSIFVKINLAYRQRRLGIITVQDCQIVWHQDIFFESNELIILKFQISFLDIYMTLEFSERRHLQYFKYLGLVIYQRKVCLSKIIVHITK